MCCCCAVCRGWDMSRGEEEKGEKQREISTVPRERKSTCETCVSEKSSGSLQERWKFFFRKILYTRERRRGWYKFLYQHLLIPDRRRLDSPLCCLCHIPTNTLSRTELTSRTLEVWAVPGPIVNRIRCAAIACVEQLATCCDESRSRNNGNSLLARWWI